MYTGTCYQGPEAGQMLTHDTQRKEYFANELLLGAYVFDGHDIWKWEEGEGT